jgi:hypothetical protein
MIATGQEKAKLSLGLINYVLRHEDVCRSKGIASTLLTSALVIVEWSASRPGRFTAGETSPRTIIQEAWLVPEPVWTLRRR